MSLLALLAVCSVAWRTGVVGAAFATRRAGPRAAPPDSAAGAANTPHLNVLSRPAGGTTSSRGVASPSADAQEAAVLHFARLGLPIYCGGGRGNYVALTFDDGPAAYTPRAVEMLKAAGDTATFFIVGKQLEYWGTDAVKEEASFGVVGDHTWNHVDLTRLSPYERQTEIVRTQQRLASITGRPVALFRPPLARYNSELDQQVQSLGLLQIIWTVDSKDSAGASSAETLDNVKAGLRPGAIILMHENRGSTLMDLPAILQAVSAAGLQTVTVPQLLALDPPSDKQVRESAAARSCVPAR